MSAAPPLVTVVIPTHDRPKLLGRAVESALRQTHKNLQVVVVDDASIVEAREALAAWLSDARLEVVRHDGKRGGAAARNTGIRAARGEYIAFLDDDDAWKPEKIARQLEKMKDADAAICGFTLREGDGPERRGSRRVGRDRWIRPPALRLGYMFGWGTSALMVRRGALEELTFDEGLPAGQDWDLLIRLSQRYRVKYFDAPLVVFDVGSHARITTAAFNLRLAHLESRTRVLTKHRNFFGRFWFNYHVAALLLYRLNARRDWPRQLFYALRRCGVLPVAYGFVFRFYHRLVGY